MVNVVPRACESGDEQGLFRRKTYTTGHTRIRTPEAYERLTGLRE
jgi:hypothetical protein